MREGRGRGQVLVTDLWGGTNDGDTVEPIMNEMGWTISWRRRQSRQRGSGCGISETMRQYSPALLSPHSVCSSRKLPMSVPAIFILLFVTVSLAHPQYRKLVCLTKDRSTKHGNDISKCRLVLKDTESEEPGRSAPEQAGCFTEKYNATSDRVYCDIFCPNAHTVFHSAFELFHPSCFQYHNYQLVERGSDWYLWRSDRCLNSTATFFFGCKFDEPFRKKYPNDAEIFRNLKARRAKA